jgi:DUF2946 family protein
MRWIRGKVRVGAGAALFALVLQLVLSFGHVHLDSADSYPALAKVVASSLAAGGAPSDSNHRSAGHDFCAICATISLASISLLPAPSGLALPTADEHTWLIEFEAGRISSGPRFLFQARAPPVLA